MATTVNFVKSHDVRFTKVSFQQTLDVLGRRVLADADVSELASITGWFGSLSASDYILLDSQSSVKALHGNFGVRGVILVLRSW